MPHTLMKIVPSSVSMVVAVQTTAAYRAAWNRERSWSDRDREPAEGVLRGEGFTRSTVVEDAAHLLYNAADSYSGQSALSGGVVTALCSECHGESGMRTLLAGRGGGLGEVDCAGIVPPGGLGRAGRERRQRTPVIDNVQRVRRELSPLAAGSNTERAGQETCFRRGPRRGAASGQDSDTGQGKKATRSTHWLVLQAEK